MLCLERALRNCRDAVPASSLTPTNRAANLCGRAAATTTLQPSQLPLENLAAFDSPSNSGASPFEVLRGRPARPAVGLSAPSSDASAGRVNPDGSRAASHAPTRRRQRPSDAEKAVLSGLGPVTGGAEEPSSSGRNSGNSNPNRSRDVAGTVPRREPPAASRPDPTGASVVAVPSVTRLPGRSAGAEGGAPNRAAATSGASTSGRPLSTSSSNRSNSSSSGVRRSSSGALGSAAASANPRPLARALGPAEQQALMLGAGPGPGPAAGPPTLRPPISPDPFSNSSLYQASMDALIRAIASRELPAPESLEPSPEASSQHGPGFTSAASQPLPPLLLPWSSAPRGVAGPGPAMSAAELLRALDRFPDAAPGGGDSLGTAGRGAVPGPGSPASGVSSSGAPATASAPVAPLTPYGATGGGGSVGGERPLAGMLFSLLSAVAPASPLAARRGAGGATPASASAAGPLPAAPLPLTGAALQQQQEPPSLPSTPSTPHPATSGPAAAQPFQPPSAAPPPAGAGTALLGPPLTAHGPAAVPLLYGAAGLALPPWASVLLPPPPPPGCGPPLDPALEWAMATLSHYATPAEPSPSELRLANRALTAHLARFRSGAAAAGADAEDAEGARRRARSGRAPAGVRVVPEAGAGLPWPLVLPLLEAVGDRLSAGAALALLQGVTRQVGPSWRTALPPRQQQHLAATLRAAFAPALRRPAAITPQTAAGLLTVMARLRLRSTPAIAMLLERVLAAAPPVPGSPAAAAAVAAAAAAAAAAAGDAAGPSASWGPAAVSPGTSPSGATSDGAPSTSGRSGGGDPAGGVTTTRIWRRGSLAAPAAASAAHGFQLRWAVAALSALVRLQPDAKDLPRRAVSRLLWAALSCSDRWGPALPAALLSWAVRLRARPAAAFMRHLTGLLLGGPRPVSAAAAAAGAYPAHRCRLRRSGTRATRVRLLSMRRGRGRGRGREIGGAQAKRRAAAERAASAAVSESGPGACLLSRMRGPELVAALGALLRLYPALRRRAAVRRRAALRRQQEEQWARAGGAAGATPVPLLELPPRALRVALALALTRRLGELRRKQLCRAPLLLARFGAPGRSGGWQAAFIARVRPRLPRANAADVMRLLQGAAAQVALAERRRVGHHASAPPAAPPPHPASPAAPPAPRKGRKRGAPAAAPAAPAPGGGAGSVPAWPQAALTPQPGPAPVAAAARVWLESELAVDALRRYVELLPVAPASLPSTVAVASALAVLWRRRDPPVGPAAPPPAARAAAPTPAPAPATRPRDSWAGAPVAAPAPATAPHAAAAAPDSALPARNAGAAPAHPRDSAGGGGAGGSGSVEALSPEGELRARRAADLAIERDFLLSQLDAHAADCLEVAQAEAEAAEAARAGAGGAGRRAGRARGGGAAARNAELAVEMLGALAGLGRPPSPRLLAALEGALGGGGGGGLTAAAWQRVRAAYAGLGLQPGRQLAVALLTFD